MMNIINPIPQCLLVQFEDKRDLALSFCRTQEFQESKLSNIKGIPVSFAEFVHAHMDSKGVITYFHEWDGYNFSDEVWRKWLPWERTKHERELIEIMEAHLNMRKPFYVIGAMIGDNETVKHELAHALWYLDANYRRMAGAIMQTFKDYDRFDYDRMCAALSNMGYADEVLDDELQAYMSTGTIAELKEIGFHEIVKPYVNRFRSNFKGALNEQQTV